MTNIISFSGQVFFARLEFSVSQAAIVSVLSVLVGTVIAFLVHYRAPIWTRRLFDLLMLSTVFLPSSIVAIGFILVWGRSGYINDILAHLGLQIKLIYGFWGIIAAHLFYNIPLAYIAVKMRLANLSADLQEAARIMGASNWQTFRYVIFPRVLPVACLAAILIFLFSALSFNIPLILGGVRWQTTEVYIYKLLTESFNYPAALQVAFLQFSAVILILLFFLSYIKKTPEKLLSVNTKKHFDIFSLITVFLQIIFGLYIILPIFSTIARGFNFNILSLLTDSDFAISLGRSIILSLVSILFSVAVASAAVVAGSEKVAKLIFLMLAVSPTVISAALLVIIGKSWPAAFFAYLVVLLPTSYYLLWSHFASAPSGFLATMRVLGAGKVQQQVQSLKFMRPALVRCSALTFVFVMGDLAISSLLMPSSSPTAMFLAFRMIGAYRFIQSASAMSIILIFIAVGVLLIFSFDRKLYVANK